MVYSLKTSEKYWPSLSLIVWYLSFPICKMRDMVPLSTVIRHYTKHKSKDNPMCTWAEPIDEWEIIEEMGWGEVVPRDGNWLSVYTVLGVGSWLRHLGLTIELTHISWLFPSHISFQSISRDCLVFVVVWWGVFLFVCSHNSNVFLWKH